MTYDDVYEEDLGLIQESLSKYSGEKAWEYFKTLYEDPDGCPLDENDNYMEHGGVNCTVDGLLSKNRIKKVEGFNEKFYETFKKYRKHPIIFFPSEHKGGINRTRATVFGDRIDYTLFDIKRHCAGEDCKMAESYELEKTKKWFESFDYDFKKIVEWMGIDGIFVNENLDVYDLEYNDERTIEEYSDKYPYDWSLEYYENVKKKVEEFYEKRC